MSDFDMTILDQLAEDLPAGDLRTILGVFETDLARLSAALSASASAGDEVAVRRSAHALAGAAGSVGAVELEKAARAAMEPGSFAVETANASAARIAGLAEMTIRMVRQFLATRLKGA